MRKIYDQCCDIYSRFSPLNRWAIKFFINIVLISVILILAGMINANGEEKKEEVKQEESKQEVLFCPKCGMEAIGAKKYCSEDGTSIVTESSMKEDPVTKLRDEALSHLYYLKRKKIADSKDAILAIQERRKQQRDRWKQKELDELLLLIDAMEMTADYVDSGGLWEKETFLVVGYYHHKGSLDPAWRDFSESLAKLEKFKQAKDLLKKLKKKRDDLISP